MQELQSALDSMANDLAVLVEQRKNIEAQESEIKQKMMETMKENNLTIWAFENGKSGPIARSISDVSAQGYRAALGPSSVQTQRPRRVSGP